MLLPRYSIRSMFYLAVGVAVFAIVVGQAVQGELWALGIALGVASLSVTWTVLVLFYAIVSLYARVAVPRGERQGTRAYYPEPASARPPSDTSEISLSSGPEALS